MTKSGAKIVIFVVKVSHSPVIKYQYTNKTNGSKVDATKFECLLVGASGSYCVAFAKVSNASTAKATYPDRSAWKLSKLQFDAYTNNAFIGSPVPFRVDLMKSALVLLNPAVDKQHIATLAKAVPEQPWTVADVSKVTGPKSMDVMAIVKSMEAERYTKRGPVADVVLINGSTVANGQAPATIQVGVWGKEKIAYLCEHQHVPIVFFNMSAKKA